MKKQNLPADIPEIRPGQSLELLKELRLQGSVRNLHRRRTDLYWIDWLREGRNEE